MEGNFPAEPENAGIRDPRYERGGTAETDRPRDQRDEGARDRDRILYTSALRRLAGITQVVASSEGAIFHNRLTHTHEVAQIARRMAQFFRGPETDAERRELAEALNLSFDELAEQNELARQMHVDPEVAEAAALAHDLGHPPFGHVAESVLNKRVSAEAPDGFEGNAQSFRVVTKLAIRREADIETGLVPVGLNLTRATLDAILKYPWLRDLDGTRYPQKLSGFRETDPARKWGAFEGEEEDFLFARSQHRIAADDDGERSLEAEIMDWADDIAYAVHDVDDFFRAGLIPLDGLLRGDERVTEEFWEGLERRWTTEEINQEWRLDQVQEVFGSLIDLIGHREPITRPFLGHDDQRGALRTVTARLIRRYVLDNDGRIHIRLPNEGNRRVVERPVRAEIEHALLKELIWQFVILHPRLASQQEGKRAVIDRLYDAFREAAENDAPLLPRPVQERLRREREEAEATDLPRLFARTATDVICSMNEQQAVSMYRRLTGQAIGSVLDAIVP
jgi:dGTPase